MKYLYLKSIAFLFVAFLLGACEDNAIPVRTEYVTTGAQVKFYNHAEGSPMINYYLGDQRVTAAAPTATGALRGLAFGNTYPSAYGYTTVPSGAFNLKAIDTTTVKGNNIRTLANNVISQREVALEESGNYSAILVGTTGNYEILMAKDNLPEPDFTKIYFRFIQTLASAPYNFDVFAYKLAVPATPTTPAIPEEKFVLATNIAFKQIGNYVSIPTGSYRVEFNKTGSTAVADRYITLNINTPALGRVYTVYLRGTWSNPAKTTHIDFWRER